ncbi:hypothetical protein [Deinococcus wulumuqiensis]|uniref:DUF2190 family protein n=1 Tax=Deinococcus wulumuqiensis TaxID=980427 RepID=A0AAV4K5I7_9DEIO|nr:hypothetical protein [Deinococcus wulumuqiensis]QII20043.1 hypothetical protein G6R31_04155 [Deinococcus wulumuqiensis R12]GGI87201.1 hypothetical protein GCM10010914_22060 [Deinococcus wulumuqiensis]GGP29979.1 hypothetical protein GCM10008021_16300 [Deinococcus wulumuqiensis]
MPAITLSPRAGVDTNSAMFAVQATTGFRVGEDIPAGSPCEIRAVTGGYAIFKLAAGAFAGIAPRAAKAGQVLAQPLTLYGVGVRFRASETPLTADVYYVGTGGTINDAPTAQDARGAFIRVSENDLLCVAQGKLA